MRFVHGEGGKRWLAVSVEAAQSARRIDRYTKPPRWCWQLGDGRQVRASRRSRAADWPLRWR